MRSPFRAHAPTQSGSIQKVFPPPGADSNSTLPLVRVRAVWIIAKPKPAHTRKNQGAKPDEIELAFAPERW